MWRLSGTKADWNSPPFSARVDLLAPSAGLHDVHVSNALLSGVSLLCVSTPEQDRAEEIADAYVRQNDLVVTYSEAPSRQVRRQYYWRALPAKPTHLGGCELIVSVQTNLLDADPNLAVLSILSSAEVSLLDEKDSNGFVPLDHATDPPAIEIGTGAILFRLPDAGYSYLQMAYPGDSGRAVLSSPADAPHSWRLKCQLFPEPLEKGVIRRGRIRGLFLPRSGDEAAALAVYREFVESPLPLTT